MDQRMNTIVRMISADGITKAEFSYKSFVKFSGNKSGELQKKITVPAQYPAVITVGDDVRMAGPTITQRLYCLEGSTAEDRQVNGVDGAFVFEVIIYREWQS
jgi:hypothetical protein